MSSGDEPAICTFGGISGVLFREGRVALGGCSEGVHAGPPCVGPIGPSGNDFIAGLASTRVGTERVGGRQGGRRRTPRGTLGGRLRLRAKSSLDTTSSHHDTGRVIVERLVGGRGIRAHKRRGRRARREVVDAGERGVGLRRRLLGGRRLAGRGRGVALLSGRQVGEGVMRDRWERRRGVPVRVVVDVHGAEAGLEVGEATLVRAVEWDGALVDDGTMADGCGGLGSLDYRW